MQGNDHVKWRENGWRSARSVEMARSNAVRVNLTNGRSLVVCSPEGVGCSPDGDVVALSSGAGIELVEPDDVVSVGVARTDPNVEMLRRGEVPPWMMYMMRQRPELFVEAARLEPEKLARVLSNGRG